MKKNNIIILLIILVILSWLLFFAFVGDVYKYEYTVNKVVNFLGNKVCYERFGVNMDIVDYDIDADTVVCEFVVDKKFTVLVDGD